MFHTAVIIIAIALLPIAIVVVVVVVFGLGIALMLAIPAAIVCVAWLAIQPPVVHTIKSGPAYSMPHVGMKCNGKMWLNHELKQYQCSEPRQEENPSPQAVESQTTRR